MKVAVIGKGKTGQAVIDLLKREEIHQVFDSQNPPTCEKLKGADVAVVFVNAAVFEHIYPVLLEAQIPVVSGVTGFRYDQKLIQSVTEAGKPWVVAHNFSLSMVLIKEALSSLGKLGSLSKETAYSLSETHHTQKLDAPSGTALSWQSWLNVDDCPIESIRKDDVKGIHALHIDNSNEHIELLHTAHSRTLFAEGALWSARYLNLHKELTGFYQFDEIVKKGVTVNELE